MVTFEDFKKLELKVGTIVAVDKHPKADKLYLLKVDIGEEEPRQLVAGIKKWYSPEELKGKKLIVIANLEPAIIRGEQSQGMLLAAEDDEDKVSILTVDKEVKDGSSVH